MPQVALPLPEQPERFPNRVRWTTSQCCAIVEAGILTGRYELIEGEVVSKMGQKPPHAYVVGTIMAWLIAVFGSEHVRIQLTVDLADSSPEYDEPEPDAAVTISPPVQFATRHPGPADLLLIVEVSDSTLRMDRVTKAALYARAGIREYWIMDIVGRQLLIHRLPSVTGYAEVVAYNEDERAATLARPDTSVLVSDLLPPVTNA